MRPNEKAPLSPSFTMGKKALKKSPARTQGGGQVVTDDGFLVDDNNMQEDANNLEPEDVFGGDSFTSNNLTTATTRDHQSILFRPEPEPAFSASRRVNVVNNNRPLFFDGVECSGSRGGGGGLARMKYDSFTGRNNNNARHGGGGHTSTLNDATYNSSNAAADERITNNNIITTTTTTYERRRRVPSPIIPLSRERNDSFRNQKQRESSLRAMASSSSNSGDGVNKKPRPRPSDSKSRFPNTGEGYSSSSSRPGAVAVSHHHHHIVEDITATTTGSGSSNSNSNDDGCIDEEMMMGVVAESPPPFGRRENYRYSVQEMQHVRPPGAVNAIQKHIHDAEDGVVELVYPHHHYHSTIQATLVDPDLERERIREEIEQQAPRALVVSDHDDDCHGVWYNNKKMRCWSSVCIAVYLLAIAALAVGLIFGLNLIGGEKPVQEVVSTTTDTNPVDLATATTTTDNNTPFKDSTATTTTTDNNTPFKDLGEECETRERVVGLPYSYSANTTLVEAQELACPTILTYDSYARWFHVTTPTTNRKNSSESSSSSPSLSSCITATAEGMDGFVVIMNVYQGTCDSLSCILATLAPTTAPEPPTSAPSPPPVWEDPDDIRDDQNEVNSTISSSKSPRPTPAPVVKPPPFFVSKKTQSQVSWPHYNSNGNYTLLVSWPAATSGNFQLNITASDCSSLEK